MTKETIQEFIDRNGSVLTAALDVYIQEMRYTARSVGGNAGVAFNEAADRAGKVKVEIEEIEMQ